VILHLSCGLSNSQLLDEGGGIRRSELDKLFNYMYSTAPRPPSPDAADTTPLVSNENGLTPTEQLV